MVLGLLKVLQCSRVIPMALGGVRKSIPAVGWVTCGLFRLPKSKSFSFFSVSGLSMGLTESVCCNQRPRGDGTGISEVSEAWSTFENRGLCLLHLHFHCPLTPQLLSLCLGFLDYPTKLLPGCHTWPPVHPTGQLLCLVLIQVLLLSLWFSCCSWGQHLLALFLLVYPPLQLKHPGASHHPPRASHLYCSASYFMPGLQP